MLANWIALTLSRRLMVLLATCVLIGFGIQALRVLPIDAFPDVSTTQVKIILKAPGMTPSEVESRIVIPIEQELLGIPAQQVLRSQSKYAIADMTLDFAEGTDIYWARQQVSERLNSVMPDLPDGISGGLAPITTPLGEMFMFTIEGPLSLSEKRSLLDTVIRPQLRGVTGVADVNTLGGEVRAYEVVPDLKALSARQLSLAQLQAAVEANNHNDGAGRVSNGEESLLVRSQGSIQSLDDLRAVGVLGQAGQLVRIGDVAEVRIGSLTRYGTVTQNGQSEGVEGLVLSLRGANAREVVRAVEGRLKKIGQTLPPGTSIHPFYSRGDLVERALATVTQSLVEAIALVLLLLLIFLGQLRSALVVAVILPLSALATFILMEHAHVSANLMSLGGLAIAIGLLVDAAVVVVENIEAQPVTPGSHGLNRIYRATREVALTVSAGMLIIVIVFLPLLSLQGLEGKLFTPVAQTIVFALLSSLVLSLTVIPVLASLILPNQVHTPPRLVRWLERAYAPLLNWALSHARWVVVFSLVALAGAAALFPFIGKSFMPTLDEGDVIMQMEKLPSIQLAQSSAIDLAVQRRVLEKVPDVAQLVARTGSDELGLDPMGLNETDTFVVLKPRAQWVSPNKEAVVEQLRKVSQAFAGINFSFTQPIEMRTAEMLSGVRGDLAIKVFGPNPAVLNELAEKIVQLLETLQGGEDINTTKNDGVQYLQIEFNRAALTRLGLSASQVQSDLRTIVEGRHAGTVMEDARRVPILIRATGGTALDAASFAEIRLPVAGGDSVPLTQIARVSVVEGPVKIDRENSARMVVVRANVSGRDLVGFVDEARAKVASQLSLPPGYSLVWGGQFENQQRASQRLLLVVPLALALIILVLFLTLGSVRQAVLVFVNIPFALVGGVVALALSGQYLSVPASVGFIALMGIAVLNGLVLVSCFNQLRAQGKALDEVVRLGAMRRLRPVMMTASITALGLIPLLLATGPGSEIQRPLAVVVIGGLVSSTLLTLVLLPILYRRFERTAQ